MSIDHEIRITAFNWLTEQVSIHGDVLSWNVLSQGFIFKDQRIPLVSPQGIFRPRLCRYPLTIRSAPDGPYDDKFSKGDVLLYRYRGDNYLHRDNIGLREAMKNSIPLIYLFGVVPGKYLATWPVFVVGDDLKNLTFTVTVDDAAIIKEDELVVKDSDEARRAYITSMVKIRLHQRSFREKVIHAYRTQCAFCRLKHPELLDAAHIIPDNEPQSRPTIDNGLSLCKLHHAAFDSLILGVRPDYIIEVRGDVLREHDGPMLQHGLKELHNKKIILPRKQESWPDRDFVNWRYQKFRDAV